MKNRNYLWILGILATGVLWFLFHASRTPSAGTLVATNMVVQTPVTGSPAVQPAVVANTINSNASDIERRYRQGLIAKDEAIRETYLERNKQPQDFYGKVIDQYGQLITGVNINANLILNDGTYGGFKVQKYSTATDGDGLFEFTGIRGADINVLVSKDGYKMGGHGEGYKGPAGNKTSPTDRAIFTMWKLRGPEKLVGSSIDAKIPHDGSSVTFDMTTGKESSNGDLRVTLSQFPLEIETGRERFDWSVKVEAINGGLLEESDPYPYWAPESGYQPSFEINVSSNSPDWLPNLEEDFYIKNTHGQYGIMHFSVHPGRSPTGLEVSFTINPSGSQNLEPDFSK